MKGIEGELDEIRDPGSLLGYPGAYKNTIDISRNLNVLSMTPAVIIFPKGTYSTHMHFLRKCYYCASRYAYLILTTGKLC